MRPLARTTPLVLATVLVACSGATRLGQPNPSTHTMTLSSVIDHASMETFAANVEKLSGGSLKIAFRDHVHEGDPNWETLLIDDVRRGDAELAYVGSRAWHDEGVSVFDPLAAPLLVDSIDLEGKVLQGEPVAGMADAMDRAGFALVGVVPGPLRMLFSRTRPFAAPADFQGATIGVAKSWVAERTFSALGAKTSTYAFTPTTSLDGLDAMETQFLSIQGYEQGSVMRFVTANAPLWPRPQVVFMSKAGFAALTDRERTVLRDAATAAIPDMLAPLKQESGDSANVLCRRGEQFIDATVDQLASLKDAVHPVYEALEQDPDSAGMVGKIQALKGSTSADAPIRCASTGSPRTETATPLDGTWSMCDTREEFIAAIRDPARGEGGVESDADVPGNVGCIDIRFGGGTYSIGPTGKAQANGTYLVDKDRVTIYQRNGEVFDFRWRVFEGSLVLSQIHGLVSPTPLVVKPWKKTGG